MSSAIESLGKYAIRRQLGRGAMGTVYEGFDPIIERVVAIKTVRLPEAGDDETAEEIARFRREAQAAGRLTHPNIVGVFDYGETADLAYIVMEYVDGPPLKSLLDKNERFPLPQILRIMEDLLAGLQFSHERGVVHRDIKPANLMLTLSGQAKIADFGIARIESSSMTQAGTVLGTPAYMSPEQFMGQVVDARSDIYSSGVLLYQLLTGERPFDGSMSAIMHKALNTEAPAPSQISVTAPRPFDGVVRRAMAKRPEDRYPSAVAFIAAIRVAAAAPSGSIEVEDDSGDATMIAAPRPSASRKAGVSPAEVAAAMRPARPDPLPEVAARGTAAGPIAKTPGSRMPWIAGGGVVGLGLIMGVGYFVMTGFNTPAPRVVEPPPVPAAPPVGTPTGTGGSATPPVDPAPPVTETKPPPPVVPVVPVTPPVVVAPPVVTPPVVVPPIAPPVGPITNTPPVADTEEVARAEIASFVAHLPCALFDGDLRDGAVKVSGVGGKAAIDGLRQKMTVIGMNPASRITQVDPVFCGWIDLLRPFAAGFGDSGPRLGLQLVGDQGFLVKDEYIRPRMTMADFRGVLRVDYLDRSGNVQHLYPQIADPKQRLAADAPRVFEPGEKLALGDHDDNNPGWQVDEPYGTDMIITVASEEALFDRARPANVEKAAVYFRDLKKALDSARARGTRTAAIAMPVETRRK